MVLSCRYLFLFNNVLLVAVVSNLILFGKCVDIKLNSGFFWKEFKMKISSCYHRGMQNSKIVINNY